MSKSSVKKTESQELLPEGWEMVIGLEIHVELATATKLFSPARNSFGSEPNQNVHPVCLGLPGTLPVINEKAIEFAARIGLALNCTVQKCVFARKNYFYPDMPKDYQITQFDEPLNIDGWVDLPVAGTRIRVERAHVEEDTGKTTHVGDSGRIHDAGYSLVDYNRAGVPLVEIVSHPDIRGPEEAKEYVDEVRAMVVAVGASDGKMEEGSLRVDANVSIRPKGSNELRTRCEIKNVNSLRSIGRAITYEAKRHVNLYEAGKEPVQETRHWDEEAGRTRDGRKKEDSDDYRYFADPDLVAVVPSPEWIAELAATQPPLPAQRRTTLVEVGATKESAALVVQRSLDSLVVDAIAAGADAKRVLNHATNNLAIEGAEELSAVDFADLVKMEDDGALTATQAKQVLVEMVADGSTPADIAAKHGFEAMDTGELEATLDEIIANSPQEWERFVSEPDERPKLQGFFVGQVMKATRGQADGKLVNQLLAKKANA